MQKGSEVCCGFCMDGSELARVIVKQKDYRCSRFKLGHPIQQAFSHIALVNTTHDLDHASRPGGATFRIRLFL